jgi:hypothetical protein
MSSRTTLLSAKCAALTVFTPETIFTAFEHYLYSKYKLTSDKLFFDYEGAKRRLENAVLLSVNESTEREDEIYGETDGETIWILRGLSLEECIETLIHEAMHDSVFIKRTTRSGEHKPLSCDLEHEVIYGLLDTRK